MDMNMKSRAIYWRCFHCGEGFTTAQREHAARHFGTDLSDTPVCLMRVPGEHSLLNALRKQEEELRRHRSEDTDLIRAMYEMQGAHARALRHAEEEGYNKGVRDMRKELAPTTEEI